MTAPRRVAVAQRAPAETVPLPAPGADAGRPPSRARNAAHSACVLAGAAGILVLLGAALLRSGAASAIASVVLAAGMAGSLLSPRTEGTGS